MAPALGAWLGCSQQGRVRGSQVTFIVAAAADHGALFCALPGCDQRYVRNSAPQPRGCQIISFAAMEETEAQRG